MNRKIKLHYKLPKFDNAGKQISGEVMTGVKNFFITNYGGLSVDSPSKGYWKSEGVVFQDVNLEYSVFIPKEKFESETRKEIPKHLKKFKEDFAQLEIFCYYHDVIST